MPRLLWTALVAGACACHRGEPPVPRGVDAAAAALPAPTPSAPKAPAPDAAARPPSAQAASAAASADAGAPPARADGGVDPGTLPQTHDEPTASGAAFDARVAALWDGIVHDDPARAMPFFFPLSAYEQVKAVGNPEADWKRRLVAHYERDIHALAEGLGRHREDATFVRIEVPEGRARWVLPGEEYNKLPYYRVYGTRVVYRVGERERSFRVSSLISWRGAWYVVHLTGFK